MYFYSFKGSTSVDNVAAPKTSVNAEESRKKTVQESVEEVGEDLQSDLYPTHVKCRIGHSDGKQRIHIIGVDTSDLSQDNVNDITDQALAELKDFQGCLSYGLTQDIEVDIPLPTNIRPARQHLLKRTHITPRVLKEGLFLCLNLYVIHG